jgi:muramoyltetrapeptide carboxypeptidase
MITPAILQKEIPLPFWLQPEKILTTILNNRFYCIVGGLEVIIGNTIGLDDNQLAGTDEQGQPIFNN